MAQLRVSLLRVSADPQVKGPEDRRNSEKCHEYSKVVSVSTQLYLSRRYWAPFFVGRHRNYLIPVVKIIRKFSRNSVILLMKVNKPIKTKNRRRRAQARKTKPIMPGGKKTKKINKKNGKDDGEFEQLIKTELQGLRRLLPPFEEMSPGRGRSQGRCVESLDSKSLDSLLPLWSG